MSADLQQAVLDLIQGRFPLASDPYGELAAQLGCTRSEVLEVVSALRSDGTVRRISASLSSRHLGYSASLCALAVPGDQEAIDQVAALVNEHVEVTHNYLRTNRYNLWFTVIAHGPDACCEVMDRIVAETGCHDSLYLPSTAIYKIRVDFSQMDGTRKSAEESRAAGCVAPEDAKAVRPFDAGDPFDLALVHWAQCDATGDDPFGDAAKSVAAETGSPTTPEQVLGRLREWRACGVLRRFGAMVKHQKMGYRFNGMVVWSAPDGCLDEAGRKLAGLPFVSHCYARPRRVTWPYNLYSMMHAKTREELEARIERARELTGLEPTVLISTKEYKKSSPVYF